MASTCKVVQSLAVGGVLFHSLPRIHRDTIHISEVQPVYMCKCMRLHIKLNAHELLQTGSQ